MKLIIAGSRDFTDYAKLKAAVDDLLMLVIEPVEIVSGGARGADKLGERYAKENGYALKVFPADWNTHGKSAGYIRNSQMADYATDCICFWDGKSPGTKMMIDLANKKGLQTTVERY